MKKFKCVKYRFLLFLKQFKVDEIELLMNYLELVVNEYNKNSLKLFNLLNNHYEDEECENVENIFDKSLKPCMPKIAKVESLSAINTADKKVVSQSSISITRANEEPQSMDYESAGGGGGDDDKLDDAEKDAVNALTHLSNTTTLRSKLLSTTTTIATSNNQIDKSNLSRVSSVRLNQPAKFYRNVYNSDYSDSNEDEEEFEQAYNDDTFGGSDADDEDLSQYLGHYANYSEVNGEEAENTDKDADESLSDEEEDYDNDDNNENENDDDDDDDDYEWKYGYNSYKPKSNNNSGYNSKTKHHQRPKHNYVKPGQTQINKINLNDGHIRSSTGRIRKFSEAIRSELEKQFQLNRYINGDDKKRLADRLNLTVRQVQKWFVHRREKYRRDEKFEKNKPYKSSTQSGGRFKSKNLNSIENVDVKEEKIDNDESMLSAAADISTVERANGVEETTVNTADETSNEDVENENNNTKNNGQNETISVAVASPQQPPNTTTTTNTVESTVTSSNDQLTETAETSLEKLFRKKHDLTQRDLNSVCQDLNLKPDQVRVWFQQRRQKYQQEQEDYFKSASKKPPQKKKSIIGAHDIEQQNGVKGRPSKIKFDMKKFELQTRHYPKSVLHHLENAYLRNRYISGSDKRILAKKLNLAPIQVERWFYTRRRKNSEKKHSGELNGKERLEMADNCDSN